MIALTTLGIVVLAAGGVALVWVGAKFKNWLVKLPLVGGLFV